jgi:hypothetical protein
MEGSKKEKMESRAVALDFPFFRLTVAYFLHFFALHFFAAFFFGAAFFFATFFAM